MMGVHSTKTTASEASQPLDLDALGVLKEVMGHEFVALLDTFLADTPKKVTALREAAEQGDMPQVEMLAHTLKGSSGNMAALALSAACSELVELARALRYAGLTQAVAAVAAEFERVRPLLLQQRS